MAGLSYWHAPRGLLLPLVGISDELPGFDRKVPSAKEFEVARNCSDSSACGRIGLCSG